MATQTLPSSSPSPKRWRGLTTSAVGLLLIAPPMLIMTILIFLPALQSLARTLFDTDTATPAFTLAHYQAFFQDRTSMSNLVFTIEITIISIVMLFLVCFPISLYLRFSTSWIAGAVQVLALFPLFVPGIILAYALIQFLGMHGLLDTALRDIGLTGYHTPYLKPSAIVIGLIWENIPFTTLILTAGLRQVDNALVECARDVGADNWVIFRRILLPLIQRPVMIVLSLTFLGVFGSYTLPYLLGPAAPQMMGPFMERTFSDVHDYTQAETQAVITFLVCSVVGLLYIRTIAKQQAGR